MKTFVRDVFSSDVESIDDFKARIHKINDTFSNKQNCQNKSKNFEFYYRGDRFCMPTQSNLFRQKLLSEEHIRFAEWQKDCDSKKSGICKGVQCGSLMCLVHMQHYKGNTRLLDFTTDPYVALRFACGNEGENCRKKVTVFCTQEIDLTKMDDEWERTLISLVNSKNPPLFGEEKLCKDWFIKVEQTFGRIERQKGLFLFMGNHHHSDIENKYIRKEKIAHELSATTGRGKLYPGYVGVLTIASSAIEGIRSELESSDKYNMNYLMDETTKGVL